MREVELTSASISSHQCAPNDRQVSAVSGAKCIDKPQQTNGLRRSARNVEVGVKTLDDLYSVEILDASQDFVEHFCDSLGNVVHQRSAA